MQTCMRAAPNGAIMASWWGMLCPAVFAKGCATVITLSTEQIMLTHAQTQRLDETGWLKMEGFMSQGLLEELRARIEELFAREGDAAGAEFKQERGARRL